MSSTMEILNEGLIGIKNSTFLDNGLWTACKARKGTTCAVSKKQIFVGDHIFRPMGNSKNRYQRVLVAEMHSLYCNGGGM